jgi:hypothetical protein
VDGLRIFDYIGILICKNVIYVAVGEGLADSWWLAVGWGTATLSGAGVGETSG